MKRSLPLRTILIRVFLGVSLLFLIVLFFAGWSFESRRGASDLERAQERAEKAGVSLLRSDYAGTGIPDEENLLKNEVFLKEFNNEGEDRLTRWRKLPVVTGKGIRTRNHPPTGEVLQYANYFKEVLSEDEARERLAEAATDFESRLDALSRVILSTPVHAIFTKSASAHSLSGVWEGINPALNIAWCLRSSALMALRSGDSEKAIVRMRVLDRWARSVERPSFNHFLFGNAIYAMNFSLVWEGIRLRVWSDEELGSIRNLLKMRDSEESFREAIRFQAAYGVELMDHPEIQKEQLWIGEDEIRLAKELGFWWNHVGLSGWQKRRKSLWVNKHLDFLEAVEAGNIGDDQQLLKGGLDFAKWSPLSETAQGLKGTISLYARFHGRGSELQRRISLIAIALERHFLTHQSYPTSLSELGVETPVIDLIDPDGRELVYQLGPGGRPVIFSRYEEETVRRVSNRRFRWQFHEGDEVESPSKKR